MSHTREFRHKATLQTYAPTRDASGAEIEAWTDAATVWVAIDPVINITSGREFWAAQAQNAMATHRIRMHYRSGIVPTKNRIVYGSRVFDVKSAINVNEANRELWLVCEEMVA